MSARERLDERTLREWSRRYSNCGRWGPDDERGTLNFVTPERVLEACALPRRGRVVACAMPFELACAGDAAAAPLHRGTRWSALEAPVARRGDGVVARGVLLDLPRHRRVPWLENGAPVLPSELDACAEATGVQVERGDVVLVRTGMMKRCLARNSWEGYCGGPAPGLSLHCARWLHEREIAAVASDTWCVEVQPSETPDCAQPLQGIVLREMGLLLGEVFFLEELAAACAEDGDYAFLFAAPPLPRAGAVGSPLHPLAIK